VVYSSGQNLNDFQKSNFINFLKKIPVGPVTGIGQQGSESEQIKV